MLGLWNFGLREAEAFENNYYKVDKAQFVVVMFLVIDDTTISAASHGILPIPTAIPVSGTTSLWHSCCLVVYRRRCKAQRIIQAARGDVHQSPPLETASVCAAAAVDTSDVNVPTARIVVGSSFHDTDRGR